MPDRYISDYDDFEDEAYLDSDVYSEELLDDLGEDWEDFLDWAKNNPRESNYPLRKDFPNDRAYKKAVQDWMREASRAFDYDSYIEELNEYTDEDWEEFLNWAKANPQESNYPLRKDFITNRAYKKALQDWLDEASITFRHRLLS